MSKLRSFKIILSSVFILSLVSSAVSAGKVYLVIGSDTAIWDGMNVGRYNCTYNQSLYTDPSRNAYKVMDPAFRADLTDSYGQPMKMTWWMMAGNIFRYATNTNVPVPNIMTLYLMKKYHGDELRINGDELTLHYHTFYWSDYDQDGIYYWNQAKTFLESKDDFKVTLAQFLLEEQVFPVSFRSGWHYMDNDWQNYLDERVLPYSMHNDYPHKKTSDPEPIDNIYDWSEAPSAFVPYHPSKDNYQVPGDSPGWEVRSASFWNTRVNDYMDTVFAAASLGTDQVACFWSHLPQSDFPENMQMIDSLAHRYADKYPDVKFRYCTAIEAMQRWRKTDDFDPPNLQFSDLITGDEVYFTIKTDEAIFQQQPFVAVKDIYGNYEVLDCERTGLNQWQTIQAVPLNTLAKAGVTACDTLGNQAMKFINYLPDDAFIDNKDPGYTESYGNWHTTSAYSWGTDSRLAELSEADSAQVSWTYPVPQSTFYNIFIQFPDIADRARRFRVLIFDDQLPLDTVGVTEGMPSKKWNYLSTVHPDEGSTLTVALNASGKNQNGKFLSADVIKISALVRERDIAVKEDRIDFGQVSVEDSADYALNLYNQGIHDLHISDIHSIQQSITVGSSFPLTVPPMSDITVPLSLLATETGNISDTLEIVSDDPVKPDIKLSISAEIVPYFHTIDKEDSAEYEEFGDWHTSVANIYGATSRYAYLNAHPLASARFTARLKKNGRYALKEIVPSTLNSTNDALYEIKVDGLTRAVYHVDQNQGSGQWVTIDTLYLPADTDIELWVKDSGHSSAGAVIRTDAVRFSLIEEGTSIGFSTDHPVKTFRLEQNYPNPFTSKTAIRYSLKSPFSGKLPKRVINNSEIKQVELIVYNVLGQKVATLVSKPQAAGTYQVYWDATGISSGIYYYQLKAGSFRCVRKMILMR